MFFSGRIITVLLVKTGNVYKMKLAVQ